MGGLKMGGLKMGGLNNAKAALKGAARYLIRIFDVNCR